MSYINFELCKSKGVTPVDWVTLQCIKQMRREPEREEDLVNVLTDEFLEKSVEKGWVETIKGKKKDSEISKLRLTKSGNKLMRDLSSFGVVDPQFETLYNWLEKIYSKRISSVKSNKKESTRRLQWFANETNIFENHLAVVLQCFVNDTYIEDINDKRPFNIKFNEFKAENPRAVLSNKIENIPWNPPNHYAKEYSLENSPLWDYLYTNRAYVNNVLSGKGLSLL